MLQWLTCACVIGSIGEQLGWSEAGLASPSAVLNFTVSLRQQNLYELERRALAISDPTSALYGKFMSEKEIRALAAVREEDVQIATSWLQASGVTSFVAHHEQIQVSTSVAHASALLQTSFIRLVHTELGERIVSVAEEYELPREVHAVLGLSGLPLPAQPVLVMSGRDVVAKITPAVLEAAYSVRGVKVERGGNSTHRQAVAEFQQSEYMSADDLQRFFRAQVPSAQPGDDQIARYVGAPGEKRPRRPGVEAALDVQYEMGIAPGIETEFWHWLPMDFCADLHAMTTVLLSYSNVSVMSISYGWQGDLSQLRCSPAQAEVVETNLAKLAAKGVSVIVASGDSGAAYHRVSSRSVVLYPSWPASSPWVTAVGATRFVNQTIGSSEMAADQFGSGGGFSTRFNRSAAPWQTSAVAAYLDQAGSLPLFPPAGSFPPNGRATPDVALLGEGYQTTLRGNVVSVGGTSASCPAFAAMVSLLNEARRQAGKPQLGCLNPFLYANAAAFTDVTRGTNAIDRRGRALPAGYAAAKGWDAATGLGSPVFGKLLAAALKL